MWAGAHAPPRKRATRCPGVTCRPAPWRTLPGSHMAGWVAVGQVCWGMQGRCVDSDGRRGAGGAERGRRAPHLLPNALKVRGGPLTLASEHAEKLEGSWRAQAPRLRPSPPPPVGAGAVWHGDAVHVARREASRAAVVAPARAAVGARGGKGQRVRAWVPPQCAAVECGAQCG